MEKTINKYSIIKFLLVVDLVLFLFNGEGDVASGTYFYKMPISTMLTLIVLIEIVALVVLLFINKSIKYDGISLILFLKIILFTILLLYDKGSINNLKSYLAVIEALTLYSIMISIPTKHMKNFIIKFMKAYLIVICVQTIIVTISINLSGTEFWRIKSYINIPIGSSNYIASVIILLFTFLICNEENKFKSNLLIIFAIIGMFFTRSKSAIVILVVSIILEFFNLSTVKKDKKKILIGAFSIIFLYCVILTLKDKFPDFFDTYINMYTNLLSGEESGTEAAFNGRFTIYNTAMDIIKEHPFLGGGLNYPSIVGTLAHNFILDTLLRAGIFNLLLLILYFGIIGYIFFKYRKEDNLIRGAGKMLFFVLIHGLFEPNIGGLIFDFSMWIIIGIGMRRYYEIKHEKLEAIEDEN